MGRGPLEQATKFGGGALPLLVSCPDPALLSASTSQGGLFGSPGRANGLGLRVGGRALGGPWDAESGFPMRPRDATARNNLVLPHSSLVLLRFPMIIRSLKGITYASLIFNLIYSVSDLFFKSSF